MAFSRRTLGFIVAALASDHAAAKTSHRKQKRHRRRHAAQDAFDHCLANPEPTCPTESRACCAEYLFRDGGRWRTTFDGAAHYCECLNASECLAGCYVIPA
jgi:hypothetical protein